MKSEQTSQGGERREGVGTAVMLAGTAVSAASVLIYQPVAGRALGTEGFAPIAVLWTVMFVIYTVLMIPTEQFVTRKLVVVGGAGGWLGRDRRVIGAAFAVGLVLGIGFVAATLDTFFDGDPVYIVITTVLLAARAIMAVGRGMLAGRRRFAAYGGTLMTEAVTLVILAVAAAVISPTTETFAWALVVGPLTVLLFRPWRARGVAASSGEAAHTGAAFLGWLVVATAASQIVIASAPIVVGLIGGTAAAVSVVFATFTLFRGPVTSAYNLVARVLPDFTELAMRGEVETLARWRRRIATAGLVLALVGAVAAYLVGPWIVELLYGIEFKPPQGIAALAGAGVGSGLGALFVGQVYVAAGRTRDLAFSWLIALTLSAIIVIALSADPVYRIAWAFAVGETTAMMALGFAPRRRPASSVTSIESLGKRED